MTLCSGSSVSLSADGHTLAVGNPADNNGTGATWIFGFDGCTYSQVGDKLVGKNTSGSSRQGKDMSTAFLWTSHLNHRCVTLPAGTSVSLSLDGCILAVGGPYDNNWKGATWVFVYDRSTYQELDTNLTDTDVSGISLLRGKDKSSTCIMCYIDKVSLILHHPRLSI